MGKFSVTALLISGLVMPVALFLLLWPRLHLSVLIAAAIAVAVGWALNIAWAFSAQRAALGAQADGSTLTIATRFGWACPAALVLLTWLVWRFAA